MSNLCCLVCSKSFPEAELPGHVASVHFRLSPFACSSCEFTAAQEAEVLQHADKEGHLPFVVDRLKSKPYLSLLTKLIIGHCSTFVKSRDFTAILSALTSQIAANENCVGDAHGSSNFFCLVCSKSFAEAQVSGHVAHDHLGFLQFACTSCEFTAAQEADVVQHMEKEGHFQCVLDRLKSNSYLGLLASLIVGHCRMFAKSKHFTEILSGLTLQVAANEEGVVADGVNYGVETLKAIPEIPVNTAEKSPGHNDDLTPHSAPVVSEQCVNTTGQLCALCPHSSEKYEGSPSLQKETHVRLHMEQQGISMDPNNPAKFYETGVEVWKRCFPPIPEPPVNVVMETDTPSSSLLVSKHGSGYPTNSRDSKIGSLIPKSHVIKKAKPVKTHELCFVCGDLVKTSAIAKQTHVWEEHMEQSERFVCSSCGNKGSMKTSLERACGASHPEIPFDIQELAVPMQTFSRQYDLCFPGKPVRRPPRLSATVAASTTAKASPQASSSLASSCSTSRRSIKRRYNTRNLGVTTPKVSLEVGACVAQAKTGIGRRLRSLDERTPQAQRASKNIKTSSNLRFGVNKKPTRAVINENECQFCHEHLSPVVLRTTEGNYSKATKQRQHALTAHFSGPQKLFECSVCGWVSRSSAEKRIATTVSCQRCDRRIAKHHNMSLTEHAVKRHFQHAQKVFECSKCGFGNNTRLNEVVLHAKKEHSGDPTVRVLNRTRKLAAKIQACYDACFPNEHLSVARKVHIHQSTVLFRRTTAAEDPGCAGPSTSGQGNVGGRNNA